MSSLKTGFMLAAASDNARDKERTYDNGVKRIPKADADKWKGDPLTDMDAIRVQMLETRRQALSLVKIVSDVLGIEPCTKCGRP